MTIVLLLFVAFAVTGARGVTDAAALLGGNERVARYLEKQGITVHEHTFDHVSALLLFIGYPRSAHSLVGSIIDAHPVRIALSRSV